MYYVGKEGDGVALLKRKDINMLEGPLFSRMLVFAIPLMLTNFLQTFYNAADMIVVGLSSEADAVGAIGTTSAFTALIVNLLIGIAVGANVVVARHIGEGDEEKTSRAVHTAAIVGLCIGLVGGLIGYMVTPSVMYAIGNRGHLLELSIRYARVYFCALPFHALSNFAMAIHRAKGDTQTPLRVLSCTGLLNVGLNLFFVLALDMSVEGVAIATGTAAAVSAIVLFGNLMRERGACRFSFKKLKLAPTEAKKIIMVGLPAGVQSSLFAISNIIIQSSVVQVNNMLCDPGAAYQPVVKGNAAAANIAAFGNTALSAAGHAVVSFTSQNVGAKNYDRVKRVAARGLLLLSLVGVVASLVLLPLRDVLLSLYGVVDGTDELSQLAYSAAVIRAWYLWPFYILHAFMACGSDILRGLGRSVLATVSSLVGSCLLRIVWIYTAFRAFPSLGMIYVSYPVTWAITAAVLCVFVFREFRRFPRDKATPKIVQE